MTYDKKNAFQRAASIKNDFSKDADERAAFSIDRNFQEHGRGSIVELSRQMGKFADTSEMSNGLIRIWKLLRTRARGTIVRTTDTIDTFKNEGHQLECGRQQKFYNCHKSNKAAATHLVSLQHNTSCVASCQRSDEKRSGLIGVKAKRPNCGIVKYLSKSLIRQLISTTSRESICRLTKC